MTIKEMYNKKAEFENQLKQLKGNSAIIKRARTITKENLEKINLMIMKAESPETFNNYKSALQGYVSNTHII